MTDELNAENNIIIFPDIDGITQEVKKLKIEISMLILERDELLFVECKNIETTYMILLGFLEFKIFEIEKYERKLGKDKDRYIFKRLIYR